MVASLPKACCILLTYRQVTTKRNLRAVGDVVKHQRKAVVLKTISNVNGPLF